jgi:transcriptional regulator with PAS, ATPase and Fis domain
MDRLPTLALVGSAAKPETLQNGRLMVIGDFTEIGRRPIGGPGRTKVTFDDRTVSSLHAKIERLRDGFYVEDLGSTNGTLMDGRPVVKATLLREGCVLFVGSQVLVFRTMTPTEISAVGADRQSPLAPVPTMNPDLAILCAKLRLLSPSSTEVFLLGETGAGKEVFAHAIHRLSGRSGQLMAINCAALPHELVESELFGYERGAHSTAKTKKLGLIATADKGTLFLDELGEMSIEVQSKLLRFLQDRTYLPIGSTRVETADVRIVAASSRVSGSSGMPAIQEALLGRLGAQPIQIPSLRERREDIGHLLAYFMQATHCDRPMEMEAFQSLFLYDWPHNVRELQKIVMEAELLSRGRETISFDHLPQSLLESVERAVAEEEEPPGADDGPPVVSAGSGATRIRRQIPSADELRSLMRRYNGNVAHVAKHLDRQWAVISRSLRRYGIDPSQFRPPGGSPDS